MKMKKPVSYALAMILVLSSVPMSVFGLTSLGNQYGDINCDGKVNGKDSLTLKLYNSGVSQSPFDEEAADINADGKVNGKDSLVLKQYLAGIINSIGPTGTTTVTSPTTQTTATTETTTAGKTATPIEDISKVVTDIEGVADYDDTSFDLQTTWDNQSATQITLNGDSYSVGGKTYTDKVYSITTEGVFVFSGNWNDGQIYVNYDGNVQIVLNGVNITSTSSAPIAIFGKKKKVVTVAANTSNTLTDASAYSTFYNDENDEPNACLFSKKGLTINGSGTLVVNGNYNNGINCKDGLKILGTTVKITAKSKGINAKDYAILKNATLNIDSQEDGIQSSNDPETEQDGTVTAGFGYVYLENCNATINSLEDGVQAYCYLYVAGGTYNITTGSNGSASSYESTDTTSRKAIKCEQNLIIKSGTITLDSYEDAIQCDDSVVINGGDITVKAYQDGVQAAGNLVMSAGTLNITTVGPVSASAQDKPWNPWGGGSSSTTTTDNDLSSKAIKAGTDVKILGGTITAVTTDHAIHSTGTMTISGGTINITSNNKGISSHGGLTINDPAKINVTKATEAVESKGIMTINGGTLNLVCSDDGLNAGGGSDSIGRGGQSSSDDGTHKIIINGGYIYMKNGGDGVDSNGTVAFNGGTVIVMGPGTGGNSPLDSQSGITYTGGTVIAIGTSSCMWSEDVVGKVTGNYIYNTSAGSVSTGSMITVVDSNSNVLSTIKSGLSGSIGICYMTDKTSSLSSCKFNLGGTYSGSLDQNGYGTGGTVSGGTTVAPGTSAGGGRQW